MSAKSKKKSNSTPKSAIKRVIWSVDAFEERSDMRNHVVGALKYLTHKVPNLALEPVYVLSPAELDLQLDFSAPWIQKYKPGAEKMLGKIVQDMGLQTRAHPEVLLQRAPSLRGSVQALLKHAAAQKADLIVLGTHARQGVSRWMVGSFAEAVIAQAKVPLLVVGPDSQSLHREHILFASDLGDASLQVFKRVIAMAKTLGARITLLHVLPHPIESVVQSGVYLMGGGWIPVGDFLRSEEAQRRRKAEKLLKEAKQAGVAAELIIDQPMGGKGTSVVQSILAHAQNKQAGMIALAAQSGAVSAAVLGSVARQVVRQAACPVWIWRAEK